MPTGSGETPSLYLCASVCVCVNTKSNTPISQRRVSTLTSSKYFFGLLVFRIKYVEVAKYFFSKCQLKCLAWIKYFDRAKYLD